MEAQCRKQVSSRAMCISPFLVMEVMERAKALERAGRSIMHLEVGEPDFPTPRAILEAGVRALRDGRTHYTHSLGHLELRESICGWYRREYQVEVSPERVIVTAGSSAAISLIMAALLEPGSEVLLSDPHYACYPNFICAFGGVPVRIPVREEEGFQFDPQAVRAHLGPASRAILLNSPANPTGIVTPLEGLAALSAAIDGRIPILSDEIYHGLVYGGRAHSILEVCPDAVVINGFSKLFAMTGWRLGYAILPPYLVRPIQKLQQNLFICAADFVQIAARAALEEPSVAQDVAGMRRAYDERRQAVLARLAAMGLPVKVVPTGAFYVFFAVREFTSDVYHFAFRILEEAGVAVTPGVDFGPGGEGYLRLSYANSLENIEEGMTRLARFFERERARVTP